MRNKLTGTRGHSSRLNITTLVMVSALASGCGGGGSSGASDNTPVTPTTGTPTATIPTQDPITPTLPTQDPIPPTIPPQDMLPPPGTVFFSDEFFRVTYPQDWTIDVTDPDFSATISDPNPNQAGGNNLCVIDSVFEPGSSLSDQVDGAVADLDSFPQPQVTFLEVNGEQAARVTGNLTDDDGVVLLVAAQVVYQTDIELANSVICLGFDASEYQPVFDSMILLQSSQDTQPPQAPPQATALFDDSFLRIAYPADWTIDFIDPNLSATITDPNPNQFGSNNNCSIFSFSSPGSTLAMEVADLTTLLDASPQPEVTFPEVNGEPAGRVIGNIITLPTATQVIYQADIEFAHAVLCVGVNASDYIPIFDSMTLVQ